MNIVRLFFIFTLVLFLPHLGYSDELSDLKAQMQELKGSYETKIKELESKIDALSQAQEKQAVKTAENEKKIADSKINVDYVGRRHAPVGNGGLVVSQSSGFGNVSLGGYADLQYFDFNNGKSAFEQQRWVISVGAQPMERLRFNGEFELEDGGPNGGKDDGEASVEQAYMDYLISDLVNIRAGALLVPFGRYNLVHDSDIQELTDRPIVDRQIIPTTWTEAGAGVHGKINPVIGNYDKLEAGYELYVVNGLDTGFSDTGLRSARGSLKMDNNQNKAVIGRLNVSPFLGQEVGLSGYFGKYDTVGNDITGTALDWLSNLGPVKWSGEYAYFGVEQPNDGTEVPNFLQGGYTRLTYDFWFKELNNTFLGRSFENPKFALIGQVDWAAIADDSDADQGNNIEHRYTIGLNYRPVENFVWKLEYQWNHTKNETIERGNSHGIVTSVAMGF